MKTLPRTIASRIEKAAAPIYRWDCPFLLSDYLDFDCESYGLNMFKPGAGRIMPGSIPGAGAQRSSARTLEIERARSPLSTQMRGEGHFPCPKLLQGNIMNCVGVSEDRLTWSLQHMRKLSPASHPHSSPSSCMLRVTSRCPNFQWLAR